MLHVAGWVSLFTLHAIWPFLWIWAMLWRDDRGWGIASGESQAGGDLAQRLDAIEARIAAIESSEGE